MGLVLSWVAPAVVLVAVWCPHFAHYYVRNPAVPAATVEASRAKPDDARLRELAGFSPGYGVARPVFALADPRGVAAKLLAGTVDVPGLPPRRVTLPFAPDDLDNDLGAGSLSFAGLVLPELLVRAYVETGEDRYLLAARDMIVGWADYEARAWLPRGFLWNDHAIAARVPVLAAFWLAYRHHPTYDPAVAARVLRFAARSGVLLARPAHFTVATNHGVMQNLALWHLALAFPELDESPRYRRLALERLDEQMGFYIDDEGVVLEHSAGYHRTGLELLAMALRYLTLLEQPVPESWARKYEAAVGVYAQLRRPDGSLPIFGDTTGEPGGDTPPAGPLTTRLMPERRAAPLEQISTWPAPAPEALYPVAGYASWWRGPAGLERAPRANQTVVTWSYFPGHGHKHADEMSVLLWGSGRAWISNVGYWPYGVAGRSGAESWRGSNAPHLVSEPRTSPRATRLIASGWSERVAALDLERRLGAGYVARRQVVHVDPDLWVVLDHASGAPAARARVQWTMAADLQLRPGGSPGSYVLEATAAGPRLVLRLASSAGTSVRELRGSLDPFGGWQVVNHQPAPAPSIVVEQPAANSWTIAVWCLAGPGGSSACPDAPVSARFSDDEDWSVSVPRGETALVVTRGGQELRSSSAGAAASAGPLALRAGPDVAVARARIRAAYETAVGKYPRFRDVEYYRLRATYALLGLVALQEVFFLAIRRFRWRAWLRYAAVLAWAAVGVWLVFVYF
ncbi:MAG TPA: heparinase II/III family protein [Candidatus Deferrimicrobiaceae bacterium]|nr:heparinase II/III family protein [Candidatus Deferrimicrobiaceae bacterium]